MDMLSIGAALALGDGGAAAQAAYQAAEAANQAASDANDAATNANGKASAANSAATAATNAAAAANTAAAGYPNLDKDAVIDRTAFNYALMSFQAELRDVQKRLATAEAKLTALT